MFFGVERFFRVFYWGILICLSELNVFYMFFYWGILIHIPELYVCFVFPKYILKFPNKKSFKKTEKKVQFQKTY